MNEKECKERIYSVRGYEQSNKYFTIDLHLYVDAVDMSGDKTLFYHEGGAHLVLSYQSHIEAGAWVDPYTTGTNICINRSAVNPIIESLTKINRFLAAFCGDRNWYPGVHFSETIDMLDKKKFTEVIGDPAFTTVESTSFVEGRFKHRLSKTTEDGSTHSIISVYHREDATTEELRTAAMLKLVKQLGSPYFSQSSLMRSIGEVSGDFEHYVSQYDTLPDHYRINSIINELNLESVVENV